MRNGDFDPTRLEAQNDAVRLLCRGVRSRNPENTCGLLSLSDAGVLVNLTIDVNKIYQKLGIRRPMSPVKFITAIKIAHLALRRRMVRTQKMRIICFVGSPIDDSDEDVS